jgi:thioredoxin-related protein
MLAPATRLAAVVPVLVTLVVGFSARPVRAADPVWRTDYNTARKEATEKGLPLFVVVGTDNCFYCRKLETIAFRDPAVAALLANAFVPLKLDAGREPALAKALKVQVYPTVVLAAQDGKIHAFLEGYLEPDRLAEHLKRTVSTATTTDWVARDFHEASKAVSAGDYPRAVSLLKGVIREAGDKPVGAKAKQVFDEIERQAAGRMARAKDLESRGQAPEAMDVLADLMRSYPGTQAAADAATHMAGLGDKPETQQRQKLRRARETLAAAKDDFAAKRFYDALQKAELLADAFPELAEGKEGVALAGEIKGNPERMAAACEQMNDRTAAMYLVLAESWERKGQHQEAVACLEKVAKISPGSKHAELAQTQLRAIRGANPAVPTGFKRNP